MIMFSFLGKECLKYGSRIISIGAYEISLELRVVNAFKMYTSKNLAPQVLFCGFGDIYFSNRDVLRGKILVLTTIQSLIIEVTVS